MIRGRLLALAFLGLALSGALPLTQAHAAGAPLPKDLQGLKGELLNLNRDISQIEKDLLFPSTETAVVFALEPSSPLKIIDAKLLVDDKDVAYHFYSESELAALAKGGMHRLFTGNVTSGQHNLKVVITLRGTNGAEQQRTASYTFTKGAQRKVIEVKPVAQATTSQGDVRFREWEVQQ
jgi:hypothetical protein